MGRKGKRRMVRITARCELDGEFSVARERRRRKRTSGEYRDLPEKVVCPACRMWAEIIQVEEIP